MIEITPLTNREKLVHMMGMTALQAVWEGMVLHQSVEYVAERTETELEYYRQYYTPQMTKEEFEDLKQQLSREVNRDRKTTLWRFLNDKKSN